MTGKIFTALTKIEAETCWSRGKLKEAMDIYNKLLASSPDMTLNTRTAIEARIQVLGKELECRLPQEDGQDLEKNIQKLLKTIAPDKSVVDLRHGAKTYYDKGLYADALENLRQLIRQNAADEFCVDTAVGCLVQLHSPEEIPVAVDLLLVESFTNAEKAAQFKFMLANKMTQKGHSRHADALHRHVDRFTSSEL